jgi:hypothetical protein
MTALFCKVMPAAKCQCDQFGSTVCGGSQRADWNRTLHSNGSCRDASSRELKFDAAGLPLAVDEVAELASGAESWLSITECPLAALPMFGWGLWRQTTHRQCLARGRRARPWA